MTIPYRFPVPETEDGRWRLTSAKWPVPHDWHDLDVYDDSAWWLRTTHQWLTRTREAPCPADERRP